MKLNYNIPEENIYTIGNPDLIKFNLEYKDLASTFELKHESNQIMYMDTALTEASVVFASRRRFIEHLLSTKEKLAEQGLRLKLKLHPAHKDTGTESLLKNEGIV